MILHYIRNSELGDLDVIEVYETLGDNAILFLAKNERKELFLAFFSFEDSYYEKWYYAQITVETYLKLKKKEISFADAFREGLAFYFVGLSDNPFVRQTEFDYDYIPFKNIFANNIKVINKDIADYSAVIHVVFSNVLVGVCTDEKILHEFNYPVYQWIINFGSEYLKKLYHNNFYYLHQFLYEFLPIVISLDEWHLLPDLAEEVIYPSDTQIDLFLKQKAEISEIFPFNSGIPKLYKFGNNFFFGYKLANKEYLLKKLDSDC